LAAKSCQPAVDCLNQAANQSNTDTSTDDAGPTHDTQDACEHINSVCANEQGFKNQDCSHSNADYDSLSASDKQIADSIVPCVMDANDCKTAFDCLNVNGQGQ
jgi:hypothetical protein